MSIALEAKVAELEKGLAVAEEALAAMSDSLAAAWKRIADLEATAARKPGPKPKDNNG